MHHSLISTIILPLHVKHHFEDCFSLWCITDALSCMFLFLYCVMHHIDLPTASRIPDASCPHSSPCCQPDAWCIIPKYSPLPALNDTSKSLQVGPTMMHYWPSWLPDASFQEPSGWTTSFCNVSLSPAIFTLLSFLLVMHHSHTMWSASHGRIWCV